MPSLPPRLLPPRLRSPSARARLRGGLAAGAAVGLVVLIGGGAARRPAATPAAQVRAVVQDFGTASARKDYRRICRDLIAPSLADKVEQFGLPCESAFRQGLKAVKGARLRIDGVRVIGAVARVAVHTTATGQPASDDTLRLVRAGGGWRIASLSAGAPPPPAGR